MTTFDSQAYFVPPGGNTEKETEVVLLVVGIVDLLTQIIYINFPFNQRVTLKILVIIKWRWIPAPSSSSTRGVWSGGGGYNPGSPTGSYVNFIDFVTIANSSNATDFGDQTAEKGYHAGFSNETRGIIAGGYNDSVGKIDVIEFITIALQEMLKILVI